MTHQEVKDERREEDNMKMMGFASSRGSYTGFYCVGGVRFWGLLLPHQSPDSNPG